MIIDGRKIADGILEELKGEVAKIKEPPYLAAVLVNPSHLEVQPLSGARRFLELKKKAAERVGIDFRIYEFPEKVSNGELRKKLNQIVKATTCGGMIIELPLPTHLNTQHILNMIPEQKDPDVLSQKSQGAFFARPVMNAERSTTGVGRSKILPPSVEAVKTIFEEYKVEPEGKVVAVFGYGLLVGKPVSHWLAQQGATVSIINEFTLNAERFSLSADIIISGVGKSGLIRSDMVKENAVVIDFGCASTENGIAGDVDFEEVSKKASLITPVPGGTGPIVVAAVLKNFVILAEELK